ncbi:ERI1 exoribonuclease [Quillaja saponaria]|uniref:ERI1 exoribonuclease n=1 Tax=Quillaja saponaria TaxID=32244 RepID=A0AAD7L0N1_QUISA|nr:ERI1 exoribonuclease [Quillaja saponaria]KAJ7949385.1 ERI1 exoribonuclease [Quillaja saponaria]
MMALENKETVQRNCEASLKCLQSNGFPYTLQCNGNSIEGFTENNDETSTYQAGDAAKPDNPLGSEFVKPPIEFHNKTTYQHDFATWSTCHFNSQKVQQCQMNAFESQFYPYPVENQFQYVPFNMFAQGYPHDLQYQEFQYFVVIDFEATCDKDKNPHPQEIIEFPSVIVSSVTGQLEACFQTYVRPTCNQLLSDFCKDLTGIQQIQVDRGVTLSEALLRHDKWLENKGIKNTNFAVVTWSNWDCRVMLESECRFKKIRKPPYFNRWINLRIPFCEVFGDVRCNLKEAVELSGLAWQGRAHCGLDDAKNTARLLALLMGRGFKFSITNSLMWQTAERALMWKQSPEQLSFSPHNPHKPKDNMHVPTFQYHTYCYCGVKSSKGMVRKPGPKQGSVFFGCGNWTVTRGARCHYFEWASQ